MLHTTVNVLAVVTATFVSFALGGVLHGAVFKGVKIGSSKKEGMPKSAVPIAIASTFVMYYVLARVLILAQAATALDGIQTALMMWAGFIAPIQIAVKYTNDLTFKTMLVNMTCMLAGLIAGGAIIGAW